MPAKPLPLEFEPVRDAAKRALGPVIPANPDTRADKNLLFDAKRTEAGRELPPYYLVYFLLVELLGFRNLGRFEKIDWSVPIGFEGKAFLIEHRKFGLGVFAHDPDTEEDAARKIVRHIKKAVKVAQPFFDWLAEQAVAASKLNVTNKSRGLHARLHSFVTPIRRNVMKRSPGRMRRLSRKERHLMVANGRESRCRCGDCGMRRVGWRWRRLNRSLAGPNTFSFT